MKKLIPVCALAAIMLAGCSGNGQKSQVDSLTIITAQYEEASSFNDSLLLLMGDIYAGLDSINMQEGLLYNAEKSGEGVDRRASIRQNLAGIKERLQQNRDMLSQMQAKLDNSTGNNSVLKKTIAELQTRIDQQEQKIADLNAQLESANLQIADLNDEVTRGKEDLAAETEAKEKAQAETQAAEAEANKVYYAIGTNKELKQNGLLEKKFLGATKVMQGDDVNMAYFTTADRRNLSMINTNGKKVKIWSNMPEGSYEIIDNGSGTQTVKITNPSQFWSRTPYLIIQID